MTNKIFPFRLDLQLFGDGAAVGPAGGAADGEAEGGVTQSEGATGVKSAAAGQKGEKTPLAAVKYGLQPTDPAEGDHSADGQNTEQIKQTEQKTDPVDVSKLKREYRLYDDNDVQNIVKSRLKSSKEAETRFQPLLDVLSMRFGTDDPAQLSKLLEDDASYFEDLAIKNGTSADEERQRSKTELQMKRTERELSALRQQLQEEKMRAEADRIYSGWKQESNALKALYPSFDLQTELANPQFASLLKTPGVSIRTAFEVVHRDEIMPALMQVTADKTKEQVAKSIAANARRPVENGNMGQAAALTKSDVTQLTKADRAEIARRVARGEKITFG